MSDLRKAVSGNSISVNTFRIDPKLFTRDMKVKVRIN